VGILLKRRSLLLAAPAIITARTMESALAQCIPALPVAPDPAIAAGFTNLVFHSDFISQPEVSPNATDTRDHFWYWDTNGVNSPSQFSINPTFIPGVTDGKPTTRGARVGVLTLNSSNDTFASCLKTTYNGQPLSDPTGTMNHGYVEAYMQFSNTVTGTGGPSGGWPAFWSFSLSGMFPNIVNGQIVAECDFMEAFPAGTAGSGTTQISTCHNWLTAGGSPTSADEFNTNGHNVRVTQPTDSGWHTVGMLWTGNGTTGTLQFYQDNVLQTLSGGSSTVNLIASTNPATSGLTAQETSLMSIFIGCARSGWPVNFDWVNLWH
jgi:hypothetical protein